MTSYIAFTKKEFLEMTRTYKLFIMITVFLLFGMMSPLTAKLTPELLRAFADSGITITISEPTAMDSWMQFFKNVSQLGLVILIIVFGGSLPAEFSKGTLIILLTKGLPRKNVILAKFTAMAAIWTMSYSVCFGVTYGYTRYFWKLQPDSARLLISAVLLWAFALLLIALLLLGGTLFHSSYGSLLFTGSVTILTFLINIIPKTQRYNPLSLASQNMTVLDGSASAAEFAPAICICVLLALLFLCLSCLIFRKSGRI